MIKAVCLETKSCFFFTLVHRFYFDPHTTTSRPSPFLAGTKWGGGDIRQQLNKFHEVSTLYTTVYALDLKYNFKGKEVKHRVSVFQR